MVSAQVQLNIFDAIVFGVLALSALLSLFRGFVREVLSLLAWVGSAMITLYNAENVSQWLKPRLGDEAAAIIVGTLGTYFVALIIISILNILLLKYIKPGKEVGILDNFLGMVFGLTKGGIIVVMGFYILTLVYDDDSMPAEIKTAWSYEGTQSATKVFVGMLPDYLQKITTLKEAPADEAETANPDAPESAPQDDGQLGVERLREMFQKSGDKTDEATQ